MRKTSPSKLLTALVLAATQFACGNQGNDSPPAAAPHSGTGVVRVRFGEVGLAAEAPVVAPRGGPGPVAAGQRGEAAVRAKYDIGPKEGIATSSGRVREPDGLTKPTLTEVKNTAYQGWTQQLRDYAAHAKENGLKFELYVRPGAALSQGLIDARAGGQVNILPIPF